VQEKSKEKLNSIKLTAVKTYSKVQKHISNPISIVFIAAMLIAFITSLSLAITTEGENFRSFLFDDSTNYFMDFFNSVHYACYDSLYTSYGVIYPPFIEIFFRTIAHLIPGGTTMSGTELRSSQVGMIIFMLVFSLNLMILGIIIFKSKKGSPVEKLLFTLLIFFSLPVISLIDRGNIIIAAISAAAIFVRYRNSTNAFYREIAYIALAVSAAIKLYPALLIFILVKDKNWWGFLRTGIYIVLLFFVPFFYFGNITVNIKAYINNVLGWSNIFTGEVISTVGTFLSGGTANNPISDFGARITSFGVSSFAEVAADELVSPTGWIQWPSGTVTYTSTFQIIAAALFNNYNALAGSTAISNVIIVAMMISGFVFKDWRCVLVWSILSVAMFTTSFTYSLCFLILPCVMFLNDSNFKNPVHWIYAVGFFLVLACFSTETAYLNLSFKGYALRLGELLARIGLLVLSVTLIWQALSRVLAVSYMAIMLFINDRPAFKKKVQNIKIVKLIMSKTERNSEKDDDKL